MLRFNTSVVEAVYPQRVTIEVRKGGRSLLMLSHGGRTSWAHFAFTRINITRTFRRKKIEDFLNVVVFSMSIVEFASTCRWSVYQDRSWLR